MSSPGSAKTTPPASAPPKKAPGQKSPTATAKAPASKSPKGTGKKTPVIQKSPEEVAAMKKAANAPPGARKSPSAPGKKSPAKKMAPSKSPASKKTPTAEGSSTDQSSSAKAPADEASTTATATAPKSVPAKKSPSTKVAPGGAKTKSPAGKKGVSPPGGKKSPTPPPGAESNDAAGKKSPTPPGTEEGENQAAKKSPSLATKGKTKSPPVGKGKIPPAWKAKMMKTPVKGPPGKVPLGKKSSTSPSVTPPPPEAGDSPQPPPGSPSPPPPPRDGEDGASPSPPPPPPADSPSPPPPPHPDDESPRAADDNDKKPPGAADAKQAPAEPVKGKKKLTAYQEAAEAERRRIAEEKKKELEEDIARRKLAAEHARQLLDAPPPKFSCKLLIASDKETLPNWAQLKMYCQVPMTEPCAKYLLDTVLAKTGWTSFDGYVFHKTTGDTPKNVASTGEIFQMNLTPMQLNFEPDSFNFVMLKKSKPEDEPVATPGDYFKARLERYYEFYEPEKLEKVESVLNDFRGHEHILMLKAKQKYGIEPTNEMILRKRAWIQRQKEIIEAAEQQAARGTFNTNSVKTLTARDKKALIAVLARDARQRIRSEAFRKWTNLTFQKRMNQLIGDFCVAANNRFIRQEFLRKMKSYAVIKKYRGHLHVASQIAVKSQSLLDELAEENTSLKGDIRKLLSQIDVLENANTKRLETLYASAETAVHELKVMASELRKKEQEQSALEKSILHLGGKYVQAVEFKDNTIKATAERQLDWEKEEENFKRRLEQMKKDSEVLQKKLHDLQVGSGKDITQGECPHCDHYFEMEGYHTSQFNNLQNMKKKAETSEADRKRLVDQLSKLIREANGQSAEEEDEEASSLKRGASIKMKGKLEGDDDGDDENGDENGEGENNKENDDNQQQQQASLINSNKESAFKRIAGVGGLSGDLYNSSTLGTTLSAKNRLAAAATASSGLLGQSTKNYFSTAGLPASMKFDPSRVRHRHDDPTSTTVKESDLFKASSLDPGVTQKLLAKKNQVQRSDLSMDYWFSSDSAMATDRARVSYDRQTAGRNLEEKAEELKRDPHVEAHRLMLLENERYQARQAAIAALSPQQRQRREMFAEQMTEQFKAEEKHARPKSRTNHDYTRGFDTLPATSSSSRMLNSIFDFQNTGAGNLRKVDILRAQQQQQQQQQQNDQSRQK